MKYYLMKLLKYFSLFMVFGGIYFLIECVYKGQVTDYRMFLLAGVLGLIIGAINNFFTFDTDFLLQCIIGGLIATLSEAIFGTYWCNMGIYIWDYSSIPFSFVNGTINLLFSIAWCGLSGICILIDDAFRYYIFNETKCPYYTIGGKLMYAFKGKKEGTE